MFKYLDYLALDKKDRNEKTLIETCASGGCALRLMIRVHLEGVRCAFVVLAGSQGPPRSTLYRQTVLSI